MALDVMAGRAPVVELPLLDIAALRADPSSRDGRDTIEQIDRACVRSGFFVVTGHGLEPELPLVFDAARRFFALPDPVKQRSAMVDNNGYAGVDSARTGGGGKEMLDIGLGGFDRWPDLAGFPRAIERYQGAALAVAADLLRALAVGLDIDPGFFAEHMTEPQCFLRMLHYLPSARLPPAGLATAGTDARAATGPHTDYGAITLLATDGGPGLEVRPVGHGWQPVQAPEGSLVINLGDMLARWTNDRYVSTPHRVVVTGDAARVSIPFFVNPDPDTIVECIPSCVGADRPCRYEPILAASFLQGRIDGAIMLDDGRP